MGETAIFHTLWKEMRARAREIDITSVYYKRDYGIYRVTPKLYSKTQ